MNFNSVQSVPGHFTFSSRPKAYFPCHLILKRNRAVDRILSGFEPVPGVMCIMPTTRHCLLIVDDEPHVCDSVHDLLRREFRVLKAHSADEGYRIMQEEEVHIVMSDQRMPQITGVELLTKVKARHPQAIRMLFTGFADLESIIAAINQGHIYQFMKKPWQPEELIAAVRQAAVEFDRLEVMATGARAPCGGSHGAQRACHGSRDGGAAASDAHSGHSPTPAARAG